MSLRQFVSASMGGEGRENELPTYYFGWGINTYARCLVH